MSKNELINSIINLVKECSDLELLLLINSLLVTQES